MIQQSEASLGYESLSARIVVGDLMEAAQQHVPDFYGSMLSIFAVPVLIKLQ